jgi:hypothetical protein
VIDGVLSIAGYPDVKAAIDGKQPNLTSASNIHWNHKCQW